MLRSNHLAKSCPSSAGGLLLATTAVDGDDVLLLLPSPRIDVYDPCACQLFPFATEITQAEGDVLVVNLYS